MSFVRWERYVSINPLAAGTDCIRFYFFINHILNMLKINYDIKSASFENSCPPFCQIWIIFTRLKLWIASARHNFKGVKIHIK